ncbi:MAG: heme-binding protein [Rhodospirillales bacterium]
MIRLSAWRAIAAAAALLLSAPQALAQGNTYSVLPALLLSTDVDRIIAQAVQEARVRGRPATIAVVDRVGNVLGVFRMNGAPVALTITTRRNPELPQGNGLEHVEKVLAPLGGAPTTDLSAIAKAVTGAYLSSSGNAFSTRTASQIIQENFNPQEFRAPGGPLYGVQFSQLPCSDLNTRGPALGAGPHRSPLGLSGDPGGLPLYKNGFVVGGIGVESDGVYTIDRIITDLDTSDEELIAVAGSFGFDAPVDIRAPRITVGGKSLRFTDRYRDDRNNPLFSNPATAPAFATINGVLGAGVAVSTYFPNTGNRAGTAYGDPVSGYAVDPTGAVSDPTLPSVFVLRDPAATATNRFPPIAGTGPAGSALTASEVATIIKNALKVGFDGRAQIRRPLNSYIQVTVSVVDVNGVILGLARTPDAPVFGTDVSLQKARSAMVMSRGPTLVGGSVASVLNTYNSAVATSLGKPVGQNALGVSIPGYAQTFKNFVYRTALDDGIAYSSRGLGNLHRPFYPDGVDGTANGPFSTAYPLWSVFNVGLQLDLIIDNIAQHLIFLQGNGADTAAQCSFLSATSVGAPTQLANGLQIFAGGFPIYRNGVLIGGIGISGDGIDQDDMVGFFGLHNAGLALATGVGNAPSGIRDDQLSPQGTRLRWVNCPFQPRAGGGDQNICRGK